MYKKKIDNYPRIENYHSPPTNKKADKSNQAEQQRKRELILFGNLITLSGIILLAIILSTIFVQLFQQNSRNSSSLTTTGSTITTTTTSTTTPLYVPTYNEACTTTCRSGTGLTCNIVSFCQCTPPQYWSYGSSSCQTCQSGWSGYMDFCWQIFNTQSNRSSAEAYCNSLNLNASLPNLDSDQKYIYMRSKYQLTSFNVFWIWPTTTVPMVFKWKNGQIISKNDFDSPDPNNHLGNDTSIFESCLVIDRGRKLMLLDYPCNFITVYFSCEYFT